jgi:aminopeptidase N
MGCARYSRGVVAHEYFHNWTGNRVTCRDWCQLSLKEGITVYRGQEFSSDMNSRGVKCIGDVPRVRAAQFPQDAGPMVRGEPGPAGGKEGTPVPPAPEHCTHAHACIDF